MPYHHFTRQEGYVISHLAVAGFSFREIGRRIGRHHASISREIRRNRPGWEEGDVYLNPVSQELSVANSVRIIYPRL